MKIKLAKCFVVYVCIRSILGPRELFLRNVQYDQTAKIFAPRKFGAIWYRELGLLWDLNLGTTGDLLHCRPERFISLQRVLVISFSDLEGVAFFRTRLTPSPSGVLSRGEVFWRGYRPVPSGNSYGNRGKNAIDTSFKIFVLHVLTVYAYAYVHVSQFMHRAFNVHVRCTGIYLHRFIRTCTYSVHISLGVACLSCSGDGGEA